MAVVAQTARRLRERMGRARVGRRREELGVGFIEEKGERKRRQGRERDVQGLQGAIDGVHQWGRMWGKGNSRLKLLYAGRRTDAGPRVARSGRLGSAMGGDGGRVAGLVAQSTLGGVGPAVSGS
jgi:hypothetical protein